MKMDMLSWTKLNPTCKVKDTKKIFYSRYLYKAVLYVPMGQIVRDDNDDSMIIEAQIAARKSNFIRFGNPGTWAYSNRRKQYEHARVDQLMYWKQNFVKHKDQLRYRIEEPLIQLYSNNEQLIYDLVAQDSAALREIYRPNNNLAKLALESNQIVVSRPPEYEYKIYLREGINLTNDIRISIGQYLTNLGSEVKIPAATLHNFTTRKLWFTNCYLYAKDNQIATFLTLMAPGIIAGIFKQVYIKP